MKHSWIVPVFAAVVLAACSNNSYDTGTGTYSLMHADFVEAHSDKYSKIDYVVTDDNDSLALLTPLSSYSVNARDTIYRSVLYYNKVQNEKGDTVAESLSFSLIPTATPVRTSLLATDSIYTDPVYLESAWMSRNRRYINLGLNIMTGEVNGKELSQTFAILEDTICSSSLGIKCAKLRFFHNQKGAPQYYKSRTYVSIPMKYFRNKLQTGDTISISVNTYDNGWVLKRFIIK